MLAAHLLECTGVALLDPEVLIPAGLQLLPVDSRQGLLKGLATGVTLETALPHR